MTLTAVISPVVPQSTFSSPKGYLTSITSISKYRIVTHNFTKDDLTNGKSPSYIVPSA